VHRVPWHSLASYHYLLLRLATGPPLATVGGYRKYGHCTWDLFFIGAMDAQWQIDVVNRVTGVDLSEQNVLLAQREVARASVLMER
jgi:hypothetical protein